MLVASAKRVLSSIRVVLWPLLRSVPPTVLLEVLAEGNSLRVPLPPECVSQTVLELVKEPTSVVAALVLLVLPVAPPGAPNPRWLPPLLMPLLLLPALLTSMWPIVQLPLRLLEPLESRRPHELILLAPVVSLAMALLATLFRLKFPRLLSHLPRDEPVQLPP